MTMKRWVIQFELVEEPDEFWGSKPNTSEVLDLIQDELNTTYLNVHNLRCIDCHSQEEK